MKKLSGKAALVTGASRGIGRAIAKRLAADGALVAVNYAGNIEAANSVIVEIKKNGGKCFRHSSESRFCRGDIQTVRNFGCRAQLAKTRYYI